MKLRLSLIPHVLFVVLAAGCGGNGTDAGPSEDGRIDIVASFFPLAELLRAVAPGDTASIVDLTPAGAEPHDLELDTGQVDLLLDADLVLALGGGFQPSLEEVVEQREGPTLDVLAAVLGTDADAERVDPHVWLDPALMSIAVAEVADALAQVDAPRSDAYRSNARAFQDELAALDGEYLATLRSCERNLLVTSHDAFGRLAERYGLRVEAIAGIAPEAEPDPERLAELTDLVRREGVTTIFTETLVSPDVAETLANEAGVEVAVLNPIEGLTEAQAEAGETYRSLMRANLDALAAGLGCDRA